MEVLIMKKQIFVILAALAVLCVSFPAYAGDWQAALEKDILEGDAIKAIENAEKAGVTKEDALYAALNLLEKYERVDYGNCNSWAIHCCEGSIYKPKTNADCSTPTNCSCSN